MYIAGHLHVLPPLDAGVVIGSFLAVSVIIKAGGLVIEMKSIRQDRKRGHADNVHPNPRVASEPHKQTPNVLCPPSFFTPAKVV